MFVSVPVARPKWDANTTAEELHKAETEEFEHWRQDLGSLAEINNITVTPYEKNIHVWQQLWRVVERRWVVWWGVAEKEMWQWSMVRCGSEVWRAVPVKCGKEWAPYGREMWGGMKISVVRCGSINWTHISVLNTAVLWATMQHMLALFLSELCILTSAWCYPQRCGSADRRRP